MNWSAIGGDKYLQNAHHNKRRRGRSNNNELKLVGIMKIVNIVYDDKRTKRDWYKILVTMIQAKDEVSKKPFMFLLFTGL